MTSIILNVDSYKASHYLQYPPDTATINSYIEAREGARYRDILFFGLQAFLIEYLSKPIKATDIEEAEALLSAHGLPFNRTGWEEILHRHKGYLPIEIEALPEGTLASPGVPLVQVRNTDPAFPWLASYIETALLRAVWYPTTVASTSYAVRKPIMAALELSSEDPQAFIGSRLHDFGARGATSLEQAGLGGLAHLVSFEGTDTIEALLYGRRYYGEEMAGYSIPAAEHSTVTSWGEPREEDAYAAIISAFGSKEGAFSIVSDSYDFWHAVESLYGDRLKDKINGMKGTLVVRPDSGDPLKIPLDTLEKLGTLFGVSFNEKGYRVLHPKVRVIQGDGMTPNNIKLLYDRLIVDGWSAENLVVGMGGGLLQRLDRDTLRFAQKASARQDTAGMWYDIAKNPSTDPSKRSKPGRQAVIRTGDRSLKACRLEELQARENLLRPVFKNGNLLTRETLKDIRTRAHAHARTHGAK